MRRRRTLALLFVACLPASGCGAPPRCEGELCLDAAAVPPAPDAGVQVTSADAACAMQSERAVLGPSKPLDIVFVIDNSGSMTDEIAAVRDNINLNFAALIQESRVDFRVVVLSRFGAEGTAVCIEPPLAGAPCSAGLYENQSPLFFQYNVEIDSVNSWCQLLSTFDRADPEGRAPDGWQAFLRPEAQKALIVITDDSASCTFERGEISVKFGGPEADPFADALAFHQALLATSPEQFGVPPDVRYRFYSFVGMAPHATVTEPWFPYEELSEELCDTAASAGLAYQALSVITDALRYPVCEGRGFDTVFRALARSVIESTKASCVFAVPQAPAGQSINRRTISLEYRAHGAGAALQLDQVADSEACDDRSFFVRGEQLELCPGACALVEADPAAQLDVLYACQVIPE